MKGLVRPGADVRRHSREGTARGQVDLDGDPIGGCAVDAVHTSFLGTTDAREDLAADGQVPVAEAGSDHVAARRPRPAAQDLVLVAEEDLRVLGVGEGLEAGVGGEVGARPLPDVAQHLHRAAIRGGVGVSAGRRAGRRRTGRGWRARGSRPAAAASHSASVGRRLPAQRAKASASSQETWITGRRGSTSSRSAHRGADPAALAVALPVHRRLGAGLLQVGDVGGVGHRSAVDPGRVRARPDGGGARCRTRIQRWPPRSREVRPRPGPSRGRRRPARPPGAPSTSAGS